MRRKAESSCCFRKRRPMSSGKGRCIIPVFLSYMGCTRRCLFCSQRGITEDDSERTFAELDLRVREYLDSRKAIARNAEIAFYGSTFTSISAPVQEAYLRWAFGWVEKGFVTSIRVSTRPDDITEEKISRLVHYGVKTVEIGIQSLDENTLRQNRRFYTLADIDRTFALLKTAPFQLGVHLMTGLYGSSETSDEQSLVAVLARHPDFLRIHPTLVIRQTALEELYLRGLYHPDTLFAAVDHCSDLLRRCQQAGTPVIRMGLHIPSNRLSEVVAGPYHPSFGDLVLKMACLKQRLESERHNESEGGKTPLPCGMEREQREALGSYNGFFAGWFQEKSRLSFNNSARR